MKNMTLRITAYIVANQRINIYKSNYTDNIMDPVTVVIVTGISVSVISAIIIGFLNRRWKKKDEKKAKETKEWEEIKQQIGLLRKAVWRISKTIVIMAKMMDDQTEKTHPELNPVIEEIANELLKEDNGVHES